MTAGALLSELREAGVVLTVSAEDRLKIDAPKGAITPELREALVKHKAELLTLVAREATKQEEQQKAEAEAARQRTEKEEARKRDEAERLRAEEEARLKAEEEKRRKDEEEKRRKAEEEAKRKAEEEKRQQAAAAEAKRKTEEEAERKRKAAEQSRLQAEEEAKRKRAEKEAADRRAAEEAKRKAEEEARRKAEEQERIRAEAEAARKRAEEEAALARKKAEEEAALAKKRAEEEAARKLEEEQARQRAEAEAARKRAEEEAERQRVEEEARQQAAAEESRRREEEERLRAEEAQRQAEEAARRKAEEETLARLKAEEEAARLLAEKEDEQRRLEEEAARRAQEEAERERAEESARRLAAEEEAQRLAAEEEARRKRDEEERAKQAALSFESTTETAAPTSQFDLTGTSAYEIDEEITLERDGSASGWVEVDMSEPEIVRHATPTGKKMTPAPVEEAAFTAEPETVIVEPEWEAAETITPSPVMAEAIEEESAYAAKEIIPVVAQVRDKGIAPVDDSDLSIIPSAVLKRLGSEDATERAAAVSDLARLGGDDSFREISASFDDPSQEVRDAAARALYNLQSDRAASFTRALREAPPERRRSIGSSLATSGLAEEAISHLMGESREKTYDAFSLLFLMSKAGEVQPLMRAIEEHPNNEVRLAVVKLLALSGQQEILPAFRRLAVRGSLPTEVRSAVMEAIYQISSQTSDASSAA